jgi:hypothetical protein
LRRLRLFLASALLCGVAGAQPLERGAFRLAWNAPKDCPTNVETLARIEALLGARGRITAFGPTHYELVLETFQGEQRFLRTMQASTCAELTDAGALVLALAIDPTLSERRATAAHGAATPEPAEGASPAAPAATAPPRKRAPKPAPPREPARPAPPPAVDPEPARAARVRLGAHAVLDFGSIADVAVGPSIGVAVEWGAWQASLEGLWLPERRSLVAPGKGGDISLVATSLRGCYRPLAGALEVLGCGAFELGSLDGGGVGTAVRTHRSGLWAAPGALLAARLRVGKNVVISLAAGGLVPIQPIDFTLDNVGLVRRVPPLVARTEAGVLAYFD